MQIKLAKQINKFSKYFIVRNSENSIFRDMMASEWFWSSKFWLPENISWKDLADFEEKGSKINKVAFPTNKK